MKKVTFRTTVLMLLLVALTVVTMSGCAINRLAVEPSKGAIGVNEDTSVGIVAQTTAAEESFATTEGLVTDTEAETEPTTGVQQTTATKPATITPTVTKSTTTRPPASKPAETKPPIITPPAVDSELLKEAKANRNKYRAEVDIILQKVNEYRKETKVPPLTLDEKLTEAAMFRAAEMAKSGVLDHKRPNGAKFSTVFRDFGINYTACGENIATGFNAPIQAIFENWIASPKHEENIRSVKYTKIGIGVAVDQQGCYYWCQLFMN